MRRESCSYFRPSYPHPASMKHGRRICGKYPMTTMNMRTKRRPRPRLRPEDLAEEVTIPLWILMILYIYALVLMGLLWLRWRSWTRFRGLSLSAERHRSYLSLFMPWIPSSWQLSWSWFAIGCVCDYQYMQYLKLLSLTPFLHIFYLASYEYFSISFFYNTRIYNISLIFPIIYTRHIYRL